MSGEKPLGGHARGEYRRTIGLIATSTFILTASFVGVLAMTQNAVSGIETRIPWYLVVSGMVFVAAIFLLENLGAEGSEILLSSLIVSTIAFGLLLLSVEGLIYAVRYPEQVFVSQLGLYFLAAGLIGTGFGFWTLNHWREFAP